MPTQSGDTEYQAVFGMDSPHITILVLQAKVQGTTAVVDGHFSGTAGHSPIYYHSREEYLFTQTSKD